MPRRRFRNVLPCLVALALAACQFMPEMGSTAAPVPTALPARPPAHASVSPDSPVLAFVARARPGERATVSDPAFGGGVVVELETEYHSASNRRCRRFAVIDGSAPPRRVTRFACFAAGGLELVTIY